MGLRFELEPDDAYDDAYDDAMHRSTPPSAPPAHLVTEEHSLVYPCFDFKVISDADRYMMQCQRESVRNRSLELAKPTQAVADGLQESANHVQTPSDEEALSKLTIHYIDKHFIGPHDHRILLKLLELAERINKPELIIYCASKLDLSLSCSNALEIFKAMWLYQSITLTKEDQTLIKTQETAQHLHHNQDSKANKAQQKLISNPNPFPSKDYGVALLHNALQLIDMKAEELLILPQFNELCYEELQLIVKRDTLQLRSEVTLYECLASWSLAECTRRQLHASPENRRSVLGALCLMPRYLCMTSTEFRSCCERIELLPPIDNSLVCDALKGKKLKNLTDRQIKLLQKFRKTRAKFAEMPVYLSDRSNRKNYPKKMRRANKGRNPDEGCCGKAGINCLRGILCIFD